MAASVTPMVSVIMTIYNGEIYAAETVQSVLDQSFGDFEFIIVDDGSTDSTLAILSGFRDERIRLIKLPENHHIAFAYNTAFRLVRGKYIAIIDSGDVWYPRKLEKQLDYLRSHPEHAGCFTWTDLIDRQGNDVNDVLKEVRDVFNCQTATREEWLRYFFFKGNRLCNPSSLISADAAREVGEHSLFYIQAFDFEWWVRFTCKFSFGVLEEPLLGFRREETGDGVSVSTPMQITHVRFYNEWMHVRYHMFEYMDPELFIRTFGEHFRCRDSRTPEELACEQAFLLTESFGGSRGYSAAGLIKLEELMSDPVTAELLRNKYQFGTKDAGAMTGTHIYYDRIAQQRIHRVEELEEALRMIKDKEASTGDLLLKEKERNSELKIRIRELEDALKEEHDANLEREKLIAELNQSISDLQNSTIWKASAPLRGIKDKLSGKKKQK